MNRVRVVVTGMGVVAPNGHGLAEFADALRSARSGIRFLPELQQLNFACQVGGVPQGIDEKRKSYLSPDQLLATNQGITYGCIAAIDAFRDAGLEPADPRGEMIYDDTGAIIGVGFSGADTFAEKLYPMVSSGKVRRLGSTMIEQLMASGVSARVGGILGLANQISTNSSACSTSTEAILMGVDRVRAGRAKRMLVGGTEGHSPYVWAGFDSMRVMCRTSNHAPERASRPMSASAGGFVPGAGAGVLVVEELQHALAHGARIYTEILGGCVNSGGMRCGGSMTAPNPVGVQRCIAGALSDAALEGSKIDYINGHLSATFADAPEVLNWATALGVTPDRMPYINSTKSLVGHCLGATGAIECVATVLQLHHGFVHASLNTEDLHADLASYRRSVPCQSLAGDFTTAIKASFGFGDVNSCVVFRKWNPHHA